MESNNERTNQGSVHDYCSVCARYWKKDKPVFDITLESESIKMNTGNCCGSSQYGWVAVDSKQRAWIVGKELMQSVRSDYKSLDPCICIVEMWYFNEIQIVQIKCGFQHVIALDTERRAYWFGRFDSGMPLSDVSSDPIPLSHRITSIRSGISSVACRDTTNEWYVWEGMEFRQSHYMISSQIQCDVNGKACSMQVV